jgi:class 3 adenylate cyclase
MKIRIPKKQSPEPAPDEIAKLDLKALKTLLKQRGDAKPSFLYKSVEKASDVGDSRYVFWLDLMGANNSMRLSLPRAARSIMKIHGAALLAKQHNKKLEINPVMDGVYGYAAERATLEKTLAEILAALANVFVQERVASSRFMVRAGVAYGPLVPGDALSAGADILKKNKKYLGGTAIGMAISHAYEAEGHASPFGVYIHESARAFAPRRKGCFPYRSNLWRWFDAEDPLTWATRRTLAAHFDWLEKNPSASLYEPESLRRHKALATEYFELYDLPPLPDGKK